jgi:hypothetical protein
VDDPGEGTDVPNAIEKKRVRHQQRMRWMHEDPEHVCSLCSYCLQPAACWDHVNPWSRGGSDHPSNLVPACAKCNGRKRDNSLLLFLYGRRWGTAIPEAWRTQPFSAAPPPTAVADPPKERFVAEDKQEADRQHIRVIESYLADVIEQYEAEHGHYDENEELYDWEFEDEEEAKGQR